MAQKVPQKKTLDSNLPINREFSAGGVVYRKVKENNSAETLWLITKSSPSELIPESFWRLPKGWIDDAGENTPGPLASGIVKATEAQLQTAALREVEEEAGVKARITKKIGTEKYFFTINDRKILKFVVFYLMEYVSDTPNGFGEETSEIGWLPLIESRKKLKNSGEKKILDKAVNLLRSGIQDSLI